MSFDIIRAGRAILHVTDLNKSREFYDALGFVETDSDEENIFYRGIEERNHHCLWLKKKPEAAVEAISYKMASEKDLDALHAHFQRQGFQTKWMEKGSQTAIGRTLRIRDVSGLPIEFYAEMDQVNRMTQQFHLHKGAKVQRIDHFNCAVPDVEKAYDYYVKQLGFSCSEYTATEEERIWAAWLHRKPSVHDVAFMNTPGPRLHHVGFWLKDPLSLIDACDVLAAMGRGKAIERGPGRHGLSNAFFLYLRDPDGHRIELYNGDYFTGDTDFEPIRWALDDPMRQTFWGHEAPDSWFEEASEVLDIHTANKISIKEPTLKKRKPNFVI
ncbi:3,4-dihydroxyphenylacetate 2,3-dioxygenase [Alteribacillus iranensis]|uniref:3,4-dihydroxyphenylacetate 2,3-dioxygenase n=1 Tax=Alteribacillus iranensis TaxID=930128 RepID=A0A1I2DPS7_9BACI|nr:3,4-dihydroxyphenylacetate 2,3-dioxygenase [Alteribacillus iranensis]SFE82478.1 3,4-dihydroxyphenylacetate 2,3-dioxygenase [Alteribacillus iranensis]